MADSGMFIRTPLPGAEPGGAGAAMSFRSFTCENIRLISDDGASGLVYEGISKNYYGAAGTTPAKLIIKECYPLGIASSLARIDSTLVISNTATTDDQEIYARYKNRFKEAFRNHTNLYQGSAREQTSVPGVTYESNGTIYIVSDASNGETFDKACVDMNIITQLQVLNRLCGVLTVIHDNGCVYLDLKPGNILAIRNANRNAPQRYTGEIKLFDFDTVTRIDELKAPDSIISGSGNWSAYEQTHPGHRDEIGPASDVYSVGVILFWLMTGKPPSANEVINAYGKWTIPREVITHQAFSGDKQGAITIAQRIFDNTLTVEPSSRYQNANALAEALSELSDALLPASTTHSDEHKEILSAVEQAASGIKEDVSRLTSVLERYTPSDIEQTNDRVKPEEGQSRSGGSATSGQGNETASLGMSKEQTAQKQKAASLFQLSKISRRKFVIGAGIGVAALATTGSVFNWVRNTKNTTYYKDIIEIYGIAQGVGEPLTPAQLLGMVDYWRIDEYPWQHITEVSFISICPCFDIVNEQSNRYKHDLLTRIARVRYEYLEEKDRKTITACKYYDSNGAVTAELSYIGVNRFTMVVKKGAPRLFLSLFFKGHSDVSFPYVEAMPVHPTYVFQVDYDGVGRVQKRVLSPDSSRDGIVNLYGSTGEQISYGDDGAIKYIEFLGQDQKPADNSLGFVGLSLQYDEDTLLILYSSKSTDDYIAQTGFSGAPMEEHYYSQDGSITRIEFYSIRQNVEDIRQRYSAIANTDGVHRYEFSQPDGTNSFVLSRYRGGSNLQESNS
jgi:serine/threonine protein kinase